MRQHQHAEVIRAYADGHQIEFRPKPNSYGTGATKWYRCKQPDFDPNFEYRVRRPKL